MWLNIDWDGDRNASTSFHSKVRHLVASFHTRQSVTRWVFFSPLRSEESKEQRAAEAASADTDEELLSDSCSNAGNIQPEGAAAPAETQSLCLHVNFNRNWFRFSRRARRRSAGGRRLCGRHDCWDTRGEQSVGGQEWFYYPTDN